jgi:hypothetical protein
MENNASEEKKTVEDKTMLLNYIHDNVIGSNINTTIHTVFGDKPNVYCDYTASGKSLKFIEDYF